MPLKIIDSTVLAKFYSTSTCGIEVV